MRNYIAKNTNCLDTITYKKKMNGARHNTFSATKKAGKESDNDDNDDDINDNNKMMMIIMIITLMIIMMVWTDTNDRSFHHCRQERHFLARYCDTGHRHCDVIIDNCPCTRKSAKFISSRDGSSRGSPVYLPSPGIHSVADKKDNNANYTTTTTIIKDSDAVI